MWCSGTTTTWEFWLLHTFLLCSQTSFIFRNFRFILWRHWNSFTVKTWCLGPYLIPYSAPVFFFTESNHLNVIRLHFISTGKPLIKPCFIVLIVQLICWYKTQALIVKHVHFISFYLVLYIHEFLYKIRLSYYGMLRLMSNIFTWWQEAAFRVTAAMLTFVSLNVSALCRRWGAASDSIRQRSNSETFSLSLVQQPSACWFSGSFHHQAPLRPKPVLKLNKLGTAAARGGWGYRTTGIVTDWIKWVWSRPRFFKL